MTKTRKSRIAAGVVASLLLLAVFVSSSPAPIPPLPPLPCVDITKTVDEPNPCFGDIVTYVICIENCGGTDLENVVVMDEELGGLLPDFPTELAPGQVACVEFPYVVEEDDPCPLLNCAVVEAEAYPPLKPELVTAKACAEICPEPCGGEGCTPGFWKNNGDKHGASAWCESINVIPISPDTRISEVFILNKLLTIRGNGKSTITDPTLLQALGANGGGVNAMTRRGCNA
jgi:hypothetical protein